jgi:hypothetical protein
MDVTFVFHPDDAAPQRVTIPDCADHMYEALVAAAAGSLGPDAAISLRCEPEGGSYGQWVFRASRITDVQATPAEVERF